MGSNKITLRFSDEKDNRIDLSSEIEKYIDSVTRERDCCPECGAFHFYAQLEYYTIVDIHNGSMNIPKARSFYLRCKRCGYRF